MSPSTAPIQPAFTLDQRNAITAWSYRRPHGRRVRIVTRHPDFLEMAEIFQRHPPAVLYLMNPTDRGTVFLARASGGAWEMEAVEPALAQVLPLAAVSWPQPAATPGRI